MVEEIYLMLKSSQVIICVNVELKTNISGISSVSIISVSVMNDPTSLIFMPVCQIDACSYCHAVR
jgi:hypothetical protein